jgi:hypothetical protein
MREIIHQCLQSGEATLTSSMMCYAILSGGYEKYLQTLLGYELYTRSGLSILSERGRCDFRGRHAGRMTAIEMGVNALPNARDGVINHIVDNVNIVFQHDRAAQVYAVGVVDSIVHFAGTKHLDLVKYPGRYPLPTLDTEVQAEIERITASVDYFHHKSLNEVRRFDFITTEFDGYTMRLSFFVCGPFTHALTRWW